MGKDELISGEWHEPMWGRPLRLSDGCWHWRWMDIGGGGYALPMEPGIHLSPATVACLKGNMVRVSSTGYPVVTEDDIAGAGREIENAEAP